MSQDLRDRATVEIGERIVTGRLPAGMRLDESALAAEVVRLKIPLTVNAVMHRANIDHVDEMVALALRLGAKRVEIAHVQYYGWALKNRAQLMPTREQVERAVQAVRRRHV